MNIDAQDIINILALKIGQLETDKAIQSIQLKKANERIKLLEEEK